MASRILGPRNQAGPVGVVLVQVQADFAGKAAGVAAASATADAGDPASAQARSPPKCTKQTSSGMVCTGHGWLLEKGHVLATLHSQHSDKHSDKQPVAELSLKSLGRVVQAAAAGTAAADAVHVFSGTASASA